MEQIWSSFLALSAVVLLSAVAGAVLLLLKKSSETSVSLSSSSPIQSLPAANYEVFLSFRGPDVRTTFADFLYSYLNRSRIRTFIDNEELHKGEEIAPSLVKAIGESKIYIPILSKDYASSKWCLQELALMVKRCKLGKGHVILPIFYLVEPRDVRHQEEGSYKKAFRKHSKKYDTETVKEWKEALKEVGKMKGWHVTESDGQGAIIDQLFSKVWSHLTRDYMLVTDDLIGIDSHVQTMKELLQFEGVKIIGIHGMGGIGKTTIAKALYNDVCAQFDGHCFLEDVRETLLKTDGVVTLQKKTISSILRLDYEVKDADEGINIIKDRICKLKVLVIIDDADDRFKFEKVLGKLEDFHMGSRFIITTRDRRVMEYFQQYELYKPEEMSEDHSLQLFSRHAFGMNYPPKEDLILSMRFVKVAAGLPLAVKVIGSLLFRKDKSFWTAKFEQLKDILPSEVQKTLRISYLELSREEQQIFLDIACFFNGEKKEPPFYMWSDCGFHPEIAISTLIQMSLIKINRQNEQTVYWMHDHVRDLGRSIVCEEDFQCPWKRSRICSNEDALDMLTDDKGTERLELLRVNIFDKNFRLTSKQFEKLSGLRYLDVHGGGFMGNFLGVLPNLRWFQLNRCSSIPIDVNMKRLVNLNLSDCPVTDDWRGWERIKTGSKLKSINLWFCTYLRTPLDLSRCGNLELIHLTGCERMRGELHIGNLSNLKVLDLSLTYIRELTGDLGKLQNLHEIHAGESGLRVVSSGIRRLPSLEFLRLQSPSLKEVPALPTSLKRLFVSSLHVPNLLDLTNLEELHLYYCDLPLNPRNLQKLSMLKLLTLSYNEDVGDLRVEKDATFTLPPSLTRLTISHFPARLPSLASLINLTELNLMYISECEISGLGEMRMLETLTIYVAPHLINLDGLEHLMLLKTLSVITCNSLEVLPSLSKLTKLQTLEISHCNLLSGIHGVDQLGESLSFLEIRSCPSLVFIEVIESLGCSITTESLLPSLSNFGKLWRFALHLDDLPVEHRSWGEQFIDLCSLQNLHEFYICGYKQLTEVKGLEKLRFLKSLYIVDCSAIRRLSYPSGLYNLVAVEILGCTQLSDVMGLEKLESLTSFRMIRCTSIEKLSGLADLKRLCVLDISGCTQLIEIVGLEGLESLTSLSMAGCSSIKLLSLSGLEKISYLNISECRQFTEVMCLEKLESLTGLKMANCTSIEKLPNLSCFEHLWELDISGCIGLTEVNGIEKLKGLTTLKIDERLHSKSSGMPMSS